MPNNIVISVSPVCKFPIMNLNQLFKLCTHEQAFIPTLLTPTISHKWVMKCPS